MTALGRKRTFRQSPKRASASRGISFLWLKFPGIWFNLKGAPVELVDGSSSFVFPSCSRGGALFPSLNRCLERALLRADKQQSLLDMAGCGTGSLPMFNTEEVFK
jgi:hypothetical protein